MGLCNSNQLRPPIPGRQIATGLSHGKDLCGRNLSDRLISRTLQYLWNRCIRLPFGSDVALGTERTMYSVNCRPLTSTLIRMPEKRSRATIRQYLIANGRRMRSMARTGAVASPRLYISLVPGAVTHSLSRWTEKIVWITKESC